MAVGTGGIAQQQTQLGAVGQQSGRFAGGQQHARRAACRTEAIGAAAAMRRVEIAVGAHRPCPQPRCRPALACSQPPSSEAFARRHRLLTLRRAVTQARRQRRDDVVVDAQRAAGTAKCANLPAHGVPALLEGPAGLRQQAVLL